MLVTKPISRAKMASKNRDSRCKARAKTGKPCQAAATAGGLCFFHANPRKASELGRIGGKNKRSTETPSVDPLPKLDKASAVQEAVDRLVADVYSGKLQPRVASGLASLLSLQLRAIETTNLERRIAKVEKLLAKAEKAQPERTQPPSPVSQEPRAEGDAATNALARKPQASEESPRTDDPSSRIA
jgi:hypothetical protein